MVESVVIVVNHNGWNHLERCLPRLLEQTVPFSSILVVDNGSIDQTRDQLTKRFPGVDQLLLDSNQGFSGGVNQGLRHVLHRKQYQLVALINNDVYLDSDWHQKASQVLVADRTLGSCATCLLKESQPQLVDSGGIVWQGPGRAENYLSGQTAPEPTEPDQEIFGACAAAALYRTRLFSEVGLFETALFAYQEDVDLALRAQAAGWRCVFVPGARGIHTGHGSNRPYPISGTYADYYNARNRLAVLVSSLPTQEWRLHWASIITGEIATLLNSVRERRGVATLAGFTRGMLRLPGVFRRRWTQQKEYHE